MTICATEARKTCTGIAVDIVIASRTIEARIAGTLIDVYRTVLATKAIHTKAAVLAYPIEARTSILAWIGCTVISVDKAIPAFIAFRAGTFIGTIGVDACGFIAAG